MAFLVLESWFISKSEGRLAGWTQGLTMLGSSECWWCHSLSLTVGPSNSQLFYPDKLSHQTLSSYYCWSKWARGILQRAGMLIWGNRKVQTKGKKAKLNCVCLNFFPWQWVSRNLALAWALGAGLAWRRGGATCLEPKVNIQEQASRVGKIGGTEKKDCSNDTVSQDFSMSEGRGTEKGSQSPQEILWETEPC